MESIAMFTENIFYIILIYGVLIILCVIKTNLKNATYSNRQ